MSRIATRRALRSNVGGLEKDRVRGSRLLLSTELAMRNQRRSRARRPEELADSERCRHGGVSGASRDARGGGHERRQL
jgi:hypothetical protein